MCASFFVLVLFVCFIFLSHWTQSTTMQHRKKNHLLRYGFSSYAPSRRSGRLAPERAHCREWEGCVCMCVYMCVLRVCVCVYRAPSSPWTSWSAAEGLVKPAPLNSTLRRWGDCNKRESWPPSLLPTGSGAEIVQDTDNSEGKGGRCGLSQLWSPIPPWKMPHRGLCCCRRRCRSDPPHYAASLTCASFWRSDQKESPERRLKPKEILVLLLLFFLLAVWRFFGFPHEVEERGRGGEGGLGLEKKLYLFLKEESWGTQGAWTSTPISGDTTCLWNCPCPIRVS